MHSQLFVVHVYELFLLYVFFLHLSISMQDGCHVDRICLAVTSQWQIDSTNSRRKTNSGFMWTFILSQKHIGLDVLSWTQRNFILLSSKEIETLRLIIWPRSTPKDSKLIVPLITNQQKILSFFCCVYPIEICIIGDMYKEIYKWSGSVILLHFISFHCHARSTEHCRAEMTRQDLYSHKP